MISCHREDSGNAAEGIVVVCTVVRMLLWESRFMDGARGDTRNGVRTKKSEGRVWSWCGERRRRGR